LRVKAPISPFLPGKFPHCIAAGKPILLLEPNISESHRLLGEDYPYWAEIDDVDAIYKHIQNLFLIYNQNRLPVNETYSQIRDYLTISYLRKTIDSLL
jgi:hypothetical protein